MYYHLMFLFYKIICQLYVIAWLLLLLTGLSKAIDLDLRWYYNPAYYKEDEVN